MSINEVNEVIMSADYSKYTTAKAFTGIDQVWKKEIEDDIKDGKFIKFTSANSSVKQLVICLIDKYNYSPKVESLGCSVHRITIGE